MDWIKRWQDNETPWDLGEPHEGSQIAFEWFAVRVGGGHLKRVCLPLCGSAYDALSFTHHGLKVKGFDLSEEAIKLANSLHKDSGLFEGVVANFFDLSNETHQFELVFDRAGLCALPPSLHDQYIGKVRELLVDGGYFSVIVFDEIHPKVVSPPYSIPCLDFMEKVSEFFDLEEAQKLNVPAKTPGILKETLYLLRKK